MIHPDDRLDAKALKIVELLLGLPDDKREASIDNHVRGDDRLKERVVSLLRATDNDDALTQWAPSAILNELVSEAPESIGQYRVDEEIGRGGMGVVYRAHRDVGDFDHTVAIKVVQGLRNNEKLAERLRVERQTLAQLKHPNIAQLFDGGETSDGDPYFIMEYVEGASLRDMMTSVQSCDQVLDIVRQIGIAAQYAHQQLTVHRDLSPGNVLVTSEGQVKLIDFGISHSLHEAGDAVASLMTRTPGYTAPERENGGRATTLSDLYSLGMIFKRLARSITWPRKSDVDAIIAKATATSPEHRYADVSAFLSDVDRYRAGHTVTARPTTVRYSLKRFFGRHPVSVVASVFALLTTVCASIILSVLYARAEQAEAVATERFNDVRSLARFMVHDLYDELAPIPGTTRGREMLADEARIYFEALKRDSDDPELSLEAAVGQVRLAGVLGNPTTANLGRREEAAELYLSAYKELQILASLPDASAHVRREFARLAHEYALFYFIAIDETENTIRLSREAQETNRTLIASDEREDEDYRRLASALSLEGMAHAWDGSRAEAMEDLQAAVDVMGNSDGPTMPGAENIRAYASALSALGDGTGILVDFTEEGSYADAIPPLQRAVFYYRALIDSPDGGVEDRRDLMNSLIKLSQNLDVTERYDEELEALQGALEMAVFLRAADPNDQSVLRRQAAILKQFSIAYTSIEDLPQAIASARSAVELSTTLYDLAPENDAYFREVADSHLMLASALHASSLDEACSAAEESRRIFADLDARGTLHSYYRDVSVPQADAILSTCQAPAGR